MCGRVNSSKKSASRGWCIWRCVAEESLLWVWVLVGRGFRGNGWKVVSITIVAFRTAFTVSRSGLILDLDSKQARLSLSALIIIIINTCSSLMQNGRMVEICFTARVEHVTRFI